MGTVGKKHLPLSHKIQKVKGTTFHLPFPLEETLKRLPESHEPLADAGKLYILMLSDCYQNGHGWQEALTIKSQNSKGQRYNMLSIFAFGRNIEKVARIT